MKLNNWKKNAVAAGVLVTVCAGIYVNWLYTGGENCKGFDRYPGCAKGYVRQSADLGGQYGSCGRR